MTPDELRQLVAQVQARPSELNDLEVKSARNGTPKRLYEAMSAFANRPGGGVLLFGLDENKDFEICGVGDPQRLQEDIAHTAAHDMEPPLRPEFTLEEIDGETVVAVEIDEVSPNRKPCYCKTAGLNAGSYIRVGNTNRQMTDYEIFGYVNARGQPTDDEQPVLDATLDDLNLPRLDGYLARLRASRPKADYLAGPREQALRMLKIVREIGGTLRPTLAGLLAFGKYPQEFFPQLVITFLHYYGIDETEKTPVGDRFLDNRKFEGPLTDLAEEAINYVLAAVRKSGAVRGVTRTDTPEYPLEAVREAVLNALAHRDYSSHARGSFVQIRLFADRVEIQSPGGLHGNVTEENLEEEQSTRNAVLMRLMEDLHLVENRGTGIKTMIEAMRRANLAPPRFDDKRSSFVVAFRNHSLLDPESTRWLQQFAREPLNDQQRLALVYLRHNDRMANDDYRRLNRVDALTATRDLRGLVQTGLIEQQSAKRWTYYTLKVPRQLPILAVGTGVGAAYAEVTVSSAKPASPPAAPTEEDQILAHVRQHKAITNSECQQLLGVNADQARYLLQKLVTASSLRAVGERRWRKYVLP